MIFGVFCGLLSCATVAADIQTLETAKKTESFNFDVPKQRADLSLIAFAEQANITLLFPFDEMKKYQANRLSGHYSISEGLGVLLYDTGLEVQVNDGGQFSILKKTTLEEEQNMNKMPKKSIIATLLAAIFAPTAVTAADADGADESETVLIIGSRSQKTRTVADSPVPVDILDASDLTSMGGTADLTDNLKALIPSYTATPATGDGSAFVRTTSLRGTSPDQTLVLVDGKRRHRSALIQLFAPAAGQGAHGADVGMIPAIALKRVEVLRDGAASQYGSDAIAGVINFVTKDASDGGTVQLQYGQHYEGESSVKFSFNKGLELGSDGFVNFSLEYVDNDALSRGIQRPDAQVLIDAGFTGVGGDSPFDDAPLTQSWGRPETSGLRTFLNAGVDLGGGTKIYGRAGYGETEGRYRFFYRAPRNAVLQAAGFGANGAFNTLVDDLGYTGDLLNTGFTPFLDGDQTDISLIGGIEGEFAGGTYYDVSVSTGSNKLEYFLNNSVNPSLGTIANPIPQMGFDTGGLKQEEINFNVDFSTPVGDNLNVAYGAEWREETYTTIAGEPASYQDANGDESGGVSGMKGITAGDAGKFSRDNYAVYLDVEQDVSQDLFIQYALRYEDFSDFGSTINWKIASRYTVSETTAIRGAISTGFHAPTPGQANYRATITTFDTTGLQVEEGVVPTTDPRAIAAGGKALEEEKSMSYSFGITSDVGESTTLTVDFYKIEVDDRIYRSGGLIAADGSAFSFYTNALDVEHSGLDVVLTSDFEWTDEVSTNISFAYGYNKIEVVGQTAVDTLDTDTGLTVSVLPVSGGSIDNIENNFPNHRFVVTANTELSDDWSLMLRANFYGEHFDERGSLADGTKSKIDAITYIDAEVTYHVNEEFSIKAGVSNLFDKFVNQIGPPFSNRLANGLQYGRRTAANYEGGSWYLTGTYEL